MNCFLKRFLGIIIATSIEGFKWVKWLGFSRVLYMSFDRFLLAVEWSISSWREYYKSVFFFNFTKPFLNDKIYSYTKKKTIWHLAICQNARLKSKIFSQFFWWEVNLRGLRAFILQKVQASSLLSITQVLERRHSYYTLVSLR